MDHAHWIEPGSPEWFARVDAEHRAGNLTRGCRDALKIMGGLIALGDDMPSEARLADAAACSVRTVQRAKVRAKQLGLLRWRRRHATEGTRRVELTCCYQATMPANPVTPRARQSGARKGKNKQVRWLGSRSVAAQLAALPPVTPDFLAMLAARRRRLGLTV